LTVGLFS